MDNIKIKNTKDEIVIKKGIIKRKYLIILLVVNVPLMTIMFTVLKETNIFKGNEFIIKMLMYEIAFMWIIFFGISITGTLFWNLSYEKIKIIKNKNLIFITGDSVKLRLTSQNKLEINISFTKEHFIFTRARFKEMCTINFTVDGNKEYKWGFRLSEKKAEEIKKIIEEYRRCFYE